VAPPHKAFIADSYGARILRVASRSPRKTTVNVNQGETLRTKKDALMVRGQPVHPQDITGVPHGRVLGPTVRLFLFSSDVSVTGSASVYYPSLIVLEKVMVNSLLEPL